MKKNINLPYYPEYFKIIKPFFFDKDISDNYTISLYGSFNNCAWNGGRINDNFKITKDSIFKINKLGISIMFTFTNYIIDLENEVGLELLRWLDESQKETGVINTIILCNEDLRLFIKKHYHFNLKFSIVGHKNLTRHQIIEEEEQLKIILYYKELETKYDTIVSQSELPLFPWFYNNIDLPKYEVIMNIVAICNYCPIYEEHYKIIADINRTVSTNNFETFSKKNLSINNQCMLSHDACKALGLGSGQCFSSWEDGIKIYNLYNHLKFEGRGDTVDIFLKREFFTEYIPLLKYVYGKDETSPNYLKTINEIKSYYI